MNDLVSTFVELHIYKERMKMASLSSVMWNMANKSLEEDSRKRTQELLNVAYGVARYERALKQIRSGLTRRGKNTSYGGGRQGTLKRKEMMELAAHALKATAGELTDE